MGWVGTDVDVAVRWELAILPDGVCKIKAKKK